MDLTGYRHTIDTFAVRHTLKIHGDARREMKRGQIAVSPEDFECIPDILAAPDSVTGTGKSRIGAETITYRKTIGDMTVFYVEEVRTGRRELAMKTMFKR